jgi:hypothetical protein
MSSRPQPYTHTLSNLLLSLILIYALLNFGFAHFLLDSQPFRQAIFETGLSKLLTQIGSYLPVVYRPVDWLVTRGNTERANLVTEAYSFAWLSAVLFALLMSLITIAYIHLLPDGMRKRAVDLFQAESRMLPLDEKATARFGRCLLAILALIVLFDAVVGTFAFEHWSSLSNMVQVRDRDFLRVALDLTFLLLLSLILFVGWAKKAAFRNGCSVAAG